MNEEKLCPLCCQNKTKGTICSECSLTQPSLRWMEAGVEPTIRGVPASQARCPQEERAQVSVEDREQVYVLQYTSNAVHFACRTCGNQLELKKPELGYTSNMFCGACDRQYWVDWHAGVLHMGLDDDQLYSRMMDRLTGTMRMNGVGRRLS